MKKNDEDDVRRWEYKKRQRERGADKSLKIKCAMNMVLQILIYFISRKFILVAV